MNTNENAEMELLLTIEHKKQELAKAQEAHANYLKREEEKKKIDQQQAKIKLYADQMFERLPTQEKTELYSIYECTPEGMFIKTVGYETTTANARKVMQVLYNLSHKHSLKKHYGVKYQPISNYNTIFDLCRLSMLPVEESN